MRFKNLLAALGFSIFTVNASAALITKTFEADVYNTNRTSVVNLGDTISWSLSYDDTSTSYTIFEDGVDGVAGTSDDTLYAISNCTDSCLLKANLTWINFSLIDQVVAEIFSEGATLRDVFGINYARAHFTSSGRQLYSFRQDSINADFQTSVLGSLSIETITAAGETSNKNIFFENIREVTGSVAVPEPSSLAVFGLAGLLLAGRRFSKK